MQNKTPKPHDPTVSFRLPRQLLELVDQRAATLQRRRSTILRELLEQALRGDQPPSVGGAAAG